MFKSVVEIVLYYFCTFFVAFVSNHQKRLICQAGIIFIKLPSGDARNLLSGLDHLYSPCPKEKEAVTPFYMSQETMPQPSIFCRSLYQTRDIGHGERTKLVGIINDSHGGYQSGKGIGCNFRGRI